MVSATLLVGDGDAGEVTNLPPDVENGPASPMPRAEVYCHTSQSFFDVIRCGDELLAFPTSPSETEDVEGELLGHVGVDSGVVMIGDRAKARARSPVPSWMPSSPPRRPPPTCAGRVASWAASRFLRRSVTACCRCSSTATVRAGSPG
jgi:hypothetical protein